MIKQREGTRNEEERHREDKRLERKRIIETRKREMRDKTEGKWGTIKRERLLSRETLKRAKGEKDGSEHKVIEKKDRWEKRIW